MHVYFSMHDSNGIGISFDVSEAAHNLFNVHAACPRIVYL